MDFLYTLSTETPKFSPLKQRGDDVNRRMHSTVNQAKTDLGADTHFSYRCAETVMFQEEFLNGT